MLLTFPHLLAVPSLGDAAQMMVLRKARKGLPHPNRPPAAAGGRAELAECSSLIVMVVRVLHAQKHLRFLKVFIFQDIYQQCHAKHIPLGSEREKKVTSMRGTHHTYISYCL